MDINLGAAAEDFLIFILDGQTSPLNIYDVPIN